MTETMITHTSIEAALAHKVAETRAKPEYLWADGRSNQKTSETGSPVVKVGVGNCALDYDLWQKLRNPALVGQYPIGLREVWEFHAANNVKKIKPDGTRNHLSMPMPFEDAKHEFGRAILISVMLPLADDVLEAYAQIIEERNPAPADTYCKVWGETNKMLDEAVAKVAMGLASRDRAVVPMTSKMVDTITEQVIPPIHRDNYHGPCKGGNFAHKSVAVMTGLAQFGISRITFRDEAADGGVERFIGPLRTMVVFDQADPVMDGSGGIVALGNGRMDELMAIADFTNTDPAINAKRHCTYIPDRAAGEEGCGLCLQYCPSGAVGTSAPESDGAYSESIKREVSRFSDGRLQFNFGRCTDERSQKAKLYPDFMCGRCLVICAARGRKRARSVNV